MVNHAKVPVTVIQLERLYNGESSENIFDVTKGWPVPSSPTTSRAMKKNHHNGPTSTELSLRVNGDNCGIIGDAGAVVVHGHVHLQYWGFTAVSWIRISIQVIDGDFLHFKYNKKINYQCPLKLLLY